MLGSLSTFQSLAILRADYEENPEAKVSIIHKRTFWVNKINISYIIFTFIKETNFLRSTTKKYMQYFY
jgi:hypothetical protein